MDRSRVVNFGAGPSALPTSVLSQAQAGLINFNNTGIGITEISHRSKDFSALLQSLESLVRQQLHVPSTHSICFAQGGGTGQFSAVVLNLLARHFLKHPNTDTDRVLQYVVTGSWSKKAAEEARRLAPAGSKIAIVVDGREHSADKKSFERIPPHDTWKLHQGDAVLTYYCENETVDGVQFSGTAGPTGFPFHLFENDPEPTLVGDYSSSFMSRPIPHLEKHAVIFAGAQKNIGPAGLTIIIVRNDCVVDVDAAAKLGAPPVPLILSYKTLVDSKSVHNTPPMFPIYVSKLVLEHIQNLGGVEKLEEINNRKQSKLYAAIGEAEKLGVFKFRVREGSRSWMNVVFTGNTPEVEKQFLEEGEKQGFLAMKGHRSVGGIRVSLYNAITEEEVDRLVHFINAFVKQKAAN